MAGVPLLVGLGFAAYSVYYALAASLYEKPELTPVPEGGSLPSLGAPWQWQLSFYVVGAAVIAATLAALSAGPLDWQP
jgi:hypothetical protein